MKKSTKIFTVIITFFLIIAVVIIGRTMIGNHFKKNSVKDHHPELLLQKL